MNESTSCINKEPLVKLAEGGSASILNYNLPQSTTYEVKSFIKLEFGADMFNQNTRRGSGGFWARLDDLKTKDNFSVKTIESMLKGQLYSPIKEIENLSLNLAQKDPRVGGEGLRIQAANVPVSTVNVTNSASYIAEKIYDDHMPVLTNRVSGRQGIKFIRRPKKATPAIYMVMHMRMASYLGDYGAGQTLKTFSLLPGETTTISLKTYKQDSETSSATESVLDSYSESATDELQTTIENSTQQTESFSETDTDTMSLETSVSGGVNLGIVNLGADVGGGASSVNTTEEAVENQVSTLESAVDHHVQTVDTKRQVEVNTETTTTSTSGTEQTTTRTLENINRGRVLNFVFRQLLQEYFTITYLHDVTFIFDNGFPHKRRSATISSIGNLLQKVMKNKQVAEMAENRIYERLCNIPDYTGTQVSFIEKVDVEAKNCIHPDAGGGKYSYVKKRSDLSQTYREKSVNGIILGVKHRIMRTPSVVVDAVLGQGEGLECYNLQLQEAANRQAHLENDKIEQAMGIIDGLDSAKEKAELYQSVFGEECCADQQSESVE